MGRIVNLATFYRPMDAHILQGQLAAAGIESFLADENVAVLYFSVNGGVRVMIDEDDMEEAEKILQKFNESQWLKRLVVFDLDGTLLNSLEDLADSANHVLAMHGYPTHPVLDYRYFVGDGVRKLIERILPADERHDTKIEECKREFIEYYDIHKEDKTTAYEGLTELLVELKNRGVMIAVATNKVHEAVAPLMKKYFPDIHFDAMFGQRKGYPVKPDPTIMNDILQAVNCLPEDALHVGDTATDMELAHNAMIESVGVTWGYRPEKELVESGADHIIHQPEQLLELL